MSFSDLHDGPVDDDEVLGCGLHRPALPGVAWVKQQRRSLQADPVALPPALAGKLDLHRNKEERVKYSYSLVSNGCGFPRQW